jgi:hypothetical protein
MMARIAGLRDNRAIEYSSNDQWRFGRERPVVDHYVCGWLSGRGPCSGTPVRAAPAIPPPSRRFAAKLRAPLQPLKRLYAYTGPYSGG